MKENWKDILSSLNPEVDQATLLRYLEGKMSDAEGQQLEEEMMASDFESDALEGLQSIDQKGRLANTVAALQADLKKRTAKKTALREKRKLKLDPVLWIAVLTLLVLAVVAFVLVRWMGGG